LSGRPAPFLLAFGAALALAACVSHGQGSGAATQTTASPTPQPTALPEVAAPPNEGAPPKWIVELSPRGKAETGAQIRIRFASDVVPVEALEAPDRQTALAKFAIDPPVPGRFVFVTPRMVTFEAEAPVPKASRVVVTIRAGLADLAGHTLASDVAYDFTTEPLALDLAKYDDTVLPQGPRPRIVLSANVRLDEASLAAHATLEAPSAAPIPLTIARDATPSPDPYATPAPESGHSFDDEPNAAYALVPDHDVPLDTTYTVRIAPGVRPALGNRPAAQGVQSRVRTYGPLAFGSLELDTTDTDRPLVSGDPKLGFTNVVDAASANASITLSPPPKPGYTLLAVSSDDVRVAINPRALAPNTAYTVTIGAALKDVFGQSLGHAQTAHFTTQALAPELWAQDGFSIFPASAGVALNVVTANLPHDRYRARYAKLEPEALIDRTIEQPGGRDAVLGPNAAWPPVLAPPVRDVESTTPVALGETFGGPTGLVVYGLAAETPLPGVAPAPLTTFSGAVQVTNVGVFAQWFPSGGYVRAQHLDDGSPIARATVDIYESNPAANASGSHLACASGRTDSTGTLVLATSRFARCLSTSQADGEAPALLAIVRDGKDWSFVRTGPYGQGLGETGYTGWSAGTPHALGTILSDRNLYQRGEDAYFSAVAYFETNGTVARGSSPRYHVTMKSPQGTTLDLGSHALDAFGSFALHRRIASDADLGDWTIAANGDRGESFTGSFTVAQFKPPNFNVTLALDKSVAVPGDVVTATTKSTYLFGAPLEGGREHLDVTRSQSAFHPKGYEAYAFGPQYLYPDTPPSLEGDVTQATLSTGADGTTTLPIAVATGLPYPADYRVDGETKDVSNLAVGDSKTFTALPSRDLIVLKGDFFGTAQTPYGFDFGVVDPAGTPVPDRVIHFVLARQVADDATQLVEGSATDHPAVRYETVAEFDETSGARVRRLQTTPGKPGLYRLRANLRGAATEATATDVTLYVTGEGGDWYRRDPRGLDVRLDKDAYLPGETATALVTSPYPDADCFFAIVRHGMIVRRTLAVHGSSIRIPFIVTSDMLPNSAVESVLTRRGASLAGGVPHGLGDLARSGFAALHVALDGEYVRVKIEPVQATVLPGGREQVKLHVSDPSGAPVQAELAVSVADDAILQLGGYRFPDLVKSVYADQPISTRFGDNRADVKLVAAERPMNKGFGYGGGTMAGPAGTRVRTNFRPVAFFDGAVRTDASGDATVSFAVPDDLTTWRVLAMATTRDARFGTSDGTFVATKPLVTNPILPQFARTGDVLQGGVSVTNVSAAAAGSDPGSVDVEGTLGGALRFASPAGPTASLKEAFAGRTGGYRFAMEVAASRPGAAAAQVAFRTTLAGASDAFSLPLPIVTDDILESVVETGTTTSGTSVPLTIDPALPSDLGGLHVALATTLLGDTLAPLDAALRGPALPFAFEAASRIGIAADRMLLERRYGSRAAAAAELAAIARERDELRTFRRHDGSYAFFPQGPSDPYTSAFVATQLAQAAAAGVDVAGELGGLRTYLRGVLADPTREDAFCVGLCIPETRLEALETLAPLGDLRSDHLEEIYAARDNFSYYERVELARHLARLPAWRARGIALRDKLLEQVYETGRRAGLVQAYDYGETPVDGQSQLLALMIETNVAPERVDRALTSLLASRGRDGTWGCACDDAEAMNAVMLYGTHDRTVPNFSGGFSVGSFALRQSFAGDTTRVVTKDLALASLPRGKTAVRIAHEPGPGTLHYMVDFDYGVRGPAPGVYQSIRIDRILRPAGGDAPPLAQFGLAAPAAPATLGAGLVFDIEDRITTDHPLEGLVVRDPLPAGLEAIDAGFRTNAAQHFESLSDWNIDYQTIERSRVITYARGLQPGVYAFHYLVRSVTPGTFAWPAAVASLALAPDEFGRTAAGTLTIAP